MAETDLQTRAWSVGVPEAMTQKNPLDMKMCASFSAVPECSWAVYTKLIRINSNISIPGNVPQLHQANRILSTYAAFEKKLFVCPFSANESQNYKLSTQLSTVLSAWRRQMSSECINHWAPLLLPFVCIMSNAKVAVYMQTGKRVNVQTVFFSRQDKRIPETKKVLMAVEKVCPRPALPVGLTVSHFSCYLTSIWWRYI